MKLCLIGLEKKRLSDLKILEEAKKVFKGVLLIPLSKIRVSTVKNKVSISYREKNLSEFDTILVRVPKDKYILSYSIMKSIPKHVFKPQGIESFILTSNRILLYNKLMEEGIKVPNVYSGGSKKTISKAFEDLKFPIMIGTPEDRGKIMVANNIREAKTMIDTMETLNQPLFLEEFHKNAELWQVYVVGNEVLASNRFYEEKLVEGKRLPKKIFNLTKDVCDAIGTEVARVDVLDMKEPLVKDVSLCPFTEKTPEEVLRKYLKKIKHITELEQGGVIVKAAESAKIAFKDFFRY